MMLLGREQNSKEGQEREMKSITLVGHEPNMAKEGTNEREAKNMTVVGREPNNKEENERETKSVTLVRREPNNKTESIPFINGVDVPTKTRHISATESDSQLNKSSRKKRKRGNTKYLKEEEKFPIGFV